MWLFPLGAAVVSLVFALLLGREWFAKRRPHVAAWAVALLMFSVASGAAAGGVLFGWTSAWYRSYYLLGAIVNVPVLALGTIYLLGSKHVAHAALALVIVACAVAAIEVAGARLDTDRLDTAGIPSGRRVMPDDVRSLSRYFSFAGSIIVVGGALSSAGRLKRGAGPAARRLVHANILIACGTIVVALAGSFARAGRGSVLGIGLLIGVTVMFLGFLRSRAPEPA